MALDPDAERVLEMVRQSGRPPYDQVTPAEARALFRAARDVLCPTPAPVAEFRDLAAPGPDGNMVPLRLYRGAGTASEEILPAPAPASEPPPSTSRPSSPRPASSPSSSNPTPSAPPW